VPAAPTPAAQDSASHDRREGAPTQDPTPTPAPKVADAPQQAASADKPAASVASAVPAAPAQAQQQAPVADATAAAPAQAVQAAPQQAPAQAPAPSAVPEQPLPQQPTTLGDLAHAAQTAIRVTTAEGGATATIVLHPQELGTVAIRLHYASDGITATVRADSPQAAQALQQAAPELRRALHEQGLSLLDLDVRDGEQDRQTARGRQQQGTRRVGSVDGVDETDESDSETTTTIDAARLPEPGRRVDVLA
jgi:flagellar hook-length control protein FliK